MHFDPILQLSFEHSNDSNSQGEDYICLKEDIYIQGWSGRSVSILVQFLMKINEIQLECFDLANKNL